MKELDIIKRLFRSDEILGCDIGSALFKFVRLKQKGDILSLVSFGLIEADVLGENIVELQRTQAYLKENGLAGCHASINIEDESLRIRRMDLPRMPPNDMKIAIRWNFREYVDGQIEKYTIAYNTLEGVKIEGDKHPILAFAVSGDSVSRMVGLAKQIGLKPTIIEPNATALLAAFDLNVKWESDKYYIMVDMGDHVTNFTALGNGLLMFSRPLAMLGYRSVVKDIARNMAVSLEEAAAIFRAYQGIGNRKISVPDDKKQKVQEVVDGFLSQLVIEIQRSIDAFCLMFNLDKMEAIFLSGGGSLVPGISEYLAKNLGITTKLFNPFEKLDTKEAGDMITNPQLYTVAVGLAVPRR